MRVLALACWMAIGWLGLPRAHAAAQPVELDWEAPEGCPNRERVLAEIASRLGPNAPQRSQLSAAGEIEATPGGYTLRLEAQGGERVLEAPSCDELAESAAVILALLVEPQAGQPSAAQMPGPQFWGGARLELLMDFGILPSPSLGPGLAVAAGIEGSSLELSGTYFPTQDVEADSNDVGDMRAFAARLAFCQRVVSRPELGACAGAEYARVIGEGSVEPAATAAATLWSLHLAVRLSLALSDALFFVFEAGGGLPLSVAEFTVKPYGTVHETAEGVVRLRTGLELRWE